MIKTFHILLVLFVACAARAEVQVKKKTRRPANLSSPGSVNTAKAGVPLLPDGSPDYSKYPNPFVVQRWSFEVEGAAGVGGDRSYGEFGAGANAYFYKWLAWRNIAFYRPDSSGAIYGLDMSERMSYELAHGLGLTAFAAPGFRFAGGGNSAPMAEAGFTVRIAGFHVGVGARGLARSWIQSGGVNETQYLLNIGSGGR